MNSYHLSLDRLPFEIIENILKCDVLSHIDVCRISCTSQLLNSMSRDNKLWRIKYFQTWPSTAKLYDPHTTDWRDEFQRRIKYKKLLCEKLLEIADHVYYIENISDESFYDLKNLCDNHPSNHPFADYILLDDLYNILNDSNRDTNLTIKYYAEKALIYVRHSMLDTVWRSILDCQPRPSLLKGACLTQQWCQPTILDCTKEVTSKINMLVKLVFDEIKNVSPSHPVIKRGYQDIQNEFGEVLEKSSWDPRQCKTILNCINEVLFKKLGWSCMETLRSLDGIYINKVLDNKVGIPIIVGIIYETLANQLGVHLLPVNFPGRFLLKFLERPESLSSDSIYAWLYIDIFEYGEFKYEPALKELSAGYEDYSPTWIEHVTPVKVFSRLCWNLVEIGRQHDEFGDGIQYLVNALELLSILCPRDMDHKLLLARVYMHLSVNIHRVISLLQEIAGSDPITTGFVAHMYELAVAQLESSYRKSTNQVLKSKPRNEENAQIKFAVGMVMKHKKYNYRCVIYGWDPLCTASTDWIKRMNVDGLKYRHNQPFYNVLVSDGSSRYAAEENLEVDNFGEPVTHLEVGKYFESFHGNYYVPNSNKKEEYPDDGGVRERILSEESSMSM